MIHAPEPTGARTTKKSENIAPTRTDRCAHQAVRESLDLRSMFELNILKETSYFQKIDFGSENDIYLIEFESFDSGNNNGAALEISSIYLKEFMCLRKIKI